MAIVTSMNDNKNGPINFYTSTERDALIAQVVEYCVQIGERQPLNGSQAAYLVVSGQVSVDGEVVRNLAAKIPHGMWNVSVRNKNHHVVVHGSLLE